MKYESKSFSVSLGGKAYADGWSRTFAKTPTTYDEWEAKWGVAPYCASGVGDGWVPLLEALAVELQALGFDFKKADQIKEKFGGLRFYITDGTKEVDDAITRAEYASFRTCEDCGATGKRSQAEPGAWVKTQCTACRETP